MQLELSHLLWHKVLHVSLPISCKIIGSIIEIDVDSLFIVIEYKRFSKQRKRRGIISETPTDASETGTVVSETGTVVSEAGTDNSETGTVISETGTVTRPVLSY